ncbi:MAG: DUF3251 domain-containing protein [Gibbsiella quercinecans]|uniref:DUF3251 domain-containing protein n=1 Tax=Gibbsiella quercinecans TaxID=929813 RepID=UPI003F3F6CEB
MSTRYRPAYLLATAVLLAGCAQQTEIPKLHNQVVELKQKLNTLTNQATALEQQNQLNQNSTRGAYLLPAANSPAKLQSSIGELSIALTQIRPEAGGTQAILQLQAPSGHTLAPFHAVVEWGPLDSASGKPLSSGSLSQSIAVGDTPPTSSKRQIELRFSGITPAQLGYVRLHSITPRDAQSPAP